MATHSGAGEGDGVAEGVGEGVGAEVGVGLGLEVGVGEGDRLGDGEGERVGVGDGLRVGVGEGVAEGKVMVKLTWQAGTGLPPTAFGLDSGAVGAISFSFCPTLDTVSKIKPPSKKLNKATNKKPASFLNESINYLCVIIITFDCYQCQYAA